MFENRKANSRNVYVQAKYYEAKGTSHKSSYRVEVIDSPSNV